MSSSGLPTSPARSDAPARPRTTTSPLPQGDVVTPTNASSGAPTPTDLPHLESTPIMRRGSSGVLRGHPVVVSPGRPLNTSNSAASGMEGAVASGSTTVPLLALSSSGGDAHNTDAVTTAGSGSGSGVLGVVLDSSTPPSLPLVLRGEDLSVNVSGRAGGAYNTESSQPTTPVLTPLSATARRTSMLGRVSSGAALGMWGAVGGGGTASHGASHPLWTMPQAILRQQSSTTASGTGTPNMNRSFAGPPEDNQPTSNIADTAQQSMEVAPASFMAAPKPTRVSSPVVQDTDALAITSNTAASGSGVTGNAAASIDAEPPPLDATTTTMISSNSSTDEDEMTAAGIVLDVPFTEVMLEIPTCSSPNNADHHASAMSAFKNVRTPQALPGLDVGAYCHWCGAHTDSFHELRLHWLLCEEKTEATIDQLVAHPLCSLQAYPAHPLRLRVAACELEGEERRQYNAQALDILNDPVCRCLGCSTAHPIRAMLRHLQADCPRHLKPSPQCPLTIEHQQTHAERQEAALVDQQWMLSQMTSEMRQRLMLGEFDWSNRGNRTSPCVRPIKSPSPGQSITTR